MKRPLRLLYRWRKSRKCAFQVQFRWGEVHASIGGVLDVSLVGGECFDTLDLWKFQEGRPNESLVSDMALAKSEFCDELGVEQKLNAALGHGTLSLGHPFPMGKSRCRSRIPLAVARIRYRLTMVGFLGPYSLNGVDIQWMTDGTGSSGSIYSDYHDGQLPSVEVSEVSGIGDKASTWDNSVGDDLAMSAIATVEAETGGAGTFVMVSISYLGGDKDTASALRSLQLELLKAAMESGIYAAGAR